MSRDSYSGILCAVFNGTQSRALEVSCQLDTTTYVGFMVLTQYVDPLDSNSLKKVSLTYSETLHHPVIVQGTKNGAYFATVFPLSGTSNLIGSNAIYQNKVYLSVLNTFFTTPSISEGNIF